MKEEQIPFGAIPQSVLYSDAFDDLDIRLLLHFECTYRLQGELDVFEYSISAMLSLFPHWKREVYRRKFRTYEAAGVLKFHRFKVQYSKRIPLYTYHPENLKALYASVRTHSETPSALCAPDRAHKKEDTKKEEKEDKKEVQSTAEPLNGLPKEKSAVISSDTIQGVSSHSTDKESIGVSPSLQCSGTATENIHNKSTAVNMVGHSSGEAKAASHSSIKSVSRQNTKLTKYQAVCLAAAEEAKKHGWNKKQEELLICAALEAMQSKAN